MARIFPIPAVTYDYKPDLDLLPVIAPPYDVLNEKSKAELQDRNPHNIVGIDLPHLPPKTVGPDETYQRAGQMYREWIEQGVLKRRGKPALFAYQQVYTVEGKTFKRRGLFANVRIQEFGPASDGKGGIHPHEQTFGAPKEDRLKLMQATKAQLSPIFGLHSDPDNRVGKLLAHVMDAKDADFFGTTTNDGVLHEVWVVEDDVMIGALAEALEPSDVFIADGHHRYGTALNYRNELQASGELGETDPANYCLFVLVAMQDPGMIVLPTHRVLGGMTGFSMEKFMDVASDLLNVEPFEGDSLDALEAALPNHASTLGGSHAMGLYVPDESDQKLFIATTRSDDPLAASHGNQSQAWRQLDVAILQHAIVEGVCEPHFCDNGQKVTWKFPHSLAQFQHDAEDGQHQLGVIMQATPLDSVRLVSEAGELMPQKSTFFYPKLATGLVINPLD